MPIDFGDIKIEGVRKEELIRLIKAHSKLKEKGCLSNSGLMYLEGLERAYNILFPMMRENK